MKIVISTPGTWKVKNNANGNKAQGKEQEGTMLPVRSAIVQGPN